MAHAGVRLRSDRVDRVTQEITVTPDEWLERYKARMVERGYPQDKVDAVTIETVDRLRLDEDPRDAADDEMFEWDNS